MLEQYKIANMNRFEQLTKVKDHFAIKSNQQKAAKSLYTCTKHDVVSEKILPK